MPNKEVEGILDVKLKLPHSRFLEMKEPQAFVIGAYPPPDYGNPKTEPD